MFALQNYTLPLTAAAAVTVSESKPYDVGNGRNNGTYKTFSLIFSPHQIARYVAKNTQAEELSISVYINYMPRSAVLVAMTNIRCSH